MNQTNPQNHTNPAHATQALMQARGTDAWAPEHTPPRHRRTTTYCGPRPAVVSILLVLAASAASASDEPPPPDKHIAPTAAPSDTQPRDESDQADETDDDLEALIENLDSDDLGSELLLFADIPVVVTASRSEQPISLSPIPTSILTAEDIHYGGLTSIADALYFVPGVSIVRTDRNRFGVGVRGLNHWASERTLTLIDGRDAEVPYNATPDWLGIPLLTEDVERVEVVRGPGGASWGANALNGVINIITKDPADTQGVLLSSRINHFGDTYSLARWGSSAGKWVWRLSAGFVDQESSQNAIVNDHFTSDDYRQQMILDGKAVYNASDDTTFTTGLSYSGSDQSSPLFEDAGDGRYNAFRAYARLDHQFSNEISGHIQLNTMYDDRHQPAYFHARSISNNLDAQLSLPKIGRHKVTFGGNVRWTQMETIRNRPDEAYFPGGAINEYSAGAFIQDRIDLAERLWLETQIRIDDNSRTHTDWAGRITMLKAVDQQGHHVLRIGGGRSYRSLNPELAEGIKEGLLFIVPDNTVSHEGVWVIDAGYHGRILEGLTFRADVYYQRYTDLLGVGILPALPIPVVTTNYGPADAYGFETELALEGKHGRASIWYTCHVFEMDNSLGNPRAHTPSQHSVGLTGRLFIGDQWTLNANYRYADHFVFPNIGGAVLPVPTLHRLDLAVARSFADKLGELQLGVEDVFNSTNRGTNEFGASPIEIPGRAFFVRCQLKF